MFKWLRSLSGLNEKIRFHERIVIHLRNEDTGKVQHIDTGTFVYKLRNLFKR